MSNRQDSPAVISLFRFFSLLWNPVLLHILLRVLKITRFCEKHKITNMFLRKILGGRDVTYILKNTKLALNVDFRICYWSYKFFYEMKIWPKKTDWCQFSRWKLKILKSYALVIFQYKIKIWNGREALMRIFPSKVINFSVRFRANLLVCPNYSYRYFIKFPIFCS